MKSSNIRGRLLIVLAVGVASSADARAHLANTGFGPFYDGMVHLVLAPEDLLPVIALALLAGLSGPRASRWVLFSLSLLWVMAGVGGIFSGAEVVTPVLAAGALILLGALVAADLKLPFALVLLLAAILGISHGYLNGTAMAPAGVAGLLGVATAVFVLFSLVSGLVVRLEALWARTAVRVAGSWIAAIGLLMLGWVFGGRQ